MHNGLKSKKVCPISLGKLHNGWKPKEMRAFGKVAQWMEKNEIDAICSRKWDGGWNSIIQLPKV
jgi:hypothetical protein